MCLAIPMRVLELRDETEGFFQVAMVDADGIRKEVRLDLVDRMPVIGDYLIIHAGFAIHTLSEEEAAINLRLLKEMAQLVAIREKEERS